MSPAARTHVAIGTLAGLAAAITFATAHAIIIVPIWDRMLGGMVGAMVAGSVVGWAYGELRVAPRAAAGAAFGALLWLSLVPVTGADVLLRLAGVHRRFELLAVVIAVLLSIAGGAMVGWRRLRTRRAAIAGAAAGLLLTLATSGPVPIANSRRALFIWLAILPASAVAGAVMGAMLCFVRRLTNQLTNQRADTMPNPFPATQSMRSSSSGATP